ncbi:Severe Depolymerization of Actin [Mucor velutinosus]|uniref:Severe Depolymerization of Actin n=1 Tax=Mucor velutinosus TaxID=708070 RepID=A0AAN7DTT1_9FUNG|nr:Severe Depolymerization of Actin [Mucor velutinosus]
MSTAPPRHIQNDLSTLLRREPADKDSIEHKDWELAYLKLQLERSRLTVRIVRDGKNKQIAEMKRASTCSIESLRQSMKHEMDQIERTFTNQLAHQTADIERLKHLCNHYRDLVSFHQAASNGDAVVDKLSIKIDELETHIDNQNGIIQELEDAVVELQTKNLQLTSNVSKTSQVDKDKMDILMRENQELQCKMDAQDNKILKLESAIADYVQRERTLIAQNDSLAKENLELIAKCRKLHEQVGSTAKPTFKAKTVYQRKPNLTQKSLNTMFHDQASSSTASSPASTQSAPSPSVSTTTHTAVTATTSTTTFTNTETSSENTSKIPLKRPLSTTLSDKTNSKVPVLTRDTKEKGDAVKVKQEQVDLDLTTATENVPDQVTHITKDTSAIRKKPKNNTSVTTASTFPVRQTARPTSAPTTPASFTTCNASHRRGRSNMIGGTCTACVNFYGTETITANIDGQQLELTGEDRIQHNSRHRHHRNQRSNTPPGFWDLDFQTPERP